MDSEIRALIPTFNSKCVRHWCIFDYKKRMSSRVLSYLVLRERILVQVMGAAGMLRKCRRVTASAALGFSAGIINLRGSQPRHALVFLAQDCGH